MKDIKTQPKWVQTTVSNLERKIQELEYKLQQEKLCNKITSEMDWFTIGLHTPEKRNLFFLDKDHANHIAVVGEGDILLVGRKHTKQ